MNVKGTKKKNQVAKANIMEQQELLKKAEVIKSNLTASTWHELETKGKFDKKMKQGMRPRNNRILWNEQVSNIKIQTRAVACSNSLRRACPCSKA